MCFVCIVIVSWSGILLAKQAPYVDEVQESLKLNVQSIDFDSSKDSAQLAALHFDESDLFRIKYYFETDKKVIDSHFAKTSIDPQKTLQINALEIKTSDPTFLEITPPLIEDVTVTAIGDSVMQGAAIALNKVGKTCLGGDSITINAKVSRSFGQACQIVTNYKDENRLGDIVVIHLGTNNSYISKKEFTRLTNMLSECSLILFVTAKSDKISACNKVNAELTQYVRETPNARLFDWRGVTEEHPEFFHTDKTHLKPNGARFYASSIFKEIAKHLDNK
jgi:lysophospholipase L1-like esterase